MAEQAEAESLRDQLLQLARDYDKLAEQAERAKMVVVEDHQ